MKPIGKSKEEKEEEGERRTNGGNCGEVGDHWEGNMLDGFRQDLRCS